ncbi:hypothetical protein K440DRAFT_622304 [Wilcoxina mikolae CBS 423.85]|nr:hypothetical protein K440DRAFT_622304 [Wilcoxina mikolae CBS 423.85]
MDGYPDIGRPPLHHPPRYLQTSWVAYQYKKRRRKNTSSYALIRPPKSCCRSVPLEGDLSVDLAHGESLPPVVGGKTRAVAICTGSRSNKKRREGENKKDTSN